MSTKFLRNKLTKVVFFLTLLGACFFNPEWVEFPAACGATRIDPIDTPLLAAGRFITPVIMAEDAPQKEIVDDSISAELPSWVDIKWFNEKDYAAFKKFYADVKAKLNTQQVVPQKAPAKGSTVAVAAPKTEEFTYPKAVKALQNWLVIRKAARKAEGIFTNIEKVIDDAQLQIVTSTPAEELDYSLLTSEEILFLEQILNPKNHPIKKGQKALNLDSEFTTCVANAKDNPSAKTECIKIYLAKIKAKKDHESFVLGQIDLLIDENQKNVLIKSTGIGITDDNRAVIIGTKKMPSKIVADSSIVNCYAKEARSPSDKTQCVKTWVGKQEINNKFKNEVAKIEALDPSSGVQAVQAPVEATDADE